MRKGKRKPLTAADLMAKLNSDPEYVAMRQRKEAELQARVAEWRRAEAPLVEELNAAGFVVNSVWDLVNTSEPYPDALPILIDHLQRSYPSRVREGIARALATSQSKCAWEVLTRLFREESAEDAKDGLAVAIAAAADNEVIEDVISLARDRTQGPSRLLLLRALERSKDPRAQAALIELESDPELETQIKIILRGRKRRRR